MACLEQSRGHGQGVFAPQRAQVDGAESRLRHLRTPIMVERIALDARRQQHDDGMVARHAGELGDMVENMRRSPVNVLHDQEDRARARKIAHHGRDGFLAAGIAPIIVHRIEQRTQMRGLRQVQQVVEKDRMARLDNAFLHPSGCGCGAQRLGAALRDGEQAAHQRANGVLALADAEIQHQCAVAGEALRLRRAARTPRPAASCRYRPRRAATRPVRSAFAGRQTTAPQIAAIPAACPPSGAWRRGA